MSDALFAIIIIIIISVVDAEKGGVKREKMAIKPTSVAIKSHSQPGEVPS